jgi:hypothetical protein
MPAPSFPLSLAAAATFALFGLTACDTPDADKSVEVGAASPGAAAPAPEPAPSAAATPPQERAPDIIVDRSSVAVGTDRVATGEPSLDDKVRALVAGRPGIEGRTVSVVVMRNAKPSYVTLVVGALRGAKASAADIKSASRDDTTQTLPLSFATSLPECAVAAWIAKDGVIDIWPSAGGTVKRIARGLAGPDMTLGTDTARAQWAGCGSPSIAIGAEDTMSWGLVFDLATGILGAPGSRASTAILLPTATPGRKLVLL